MFDPNNRGVSDVADAFNASEDLGLSSGEVQNDFGEVITLGYE